MAQNSKITLKDIAQKTNFSVTTVSRVLSGRASKFRISKKTEEIIFAAAKEENFTPNQIAMSLRTSKTYTIGLIIPDITNPFFANIAQQIEQEARNDNYAIILSNSSESTTNEIKSVQTLQNRDVDGFIISPVGKESEHIKSLYENNKPVVLIDRYFPGLTIPYVATDNYKGAFEAVSYLIKTGHKKIACIQGFEASLTSQERTRGYKDALKSGNIPVKNYFLQGEGFDIENGYLSTKLLLNQSNIPTAIFAQGNLIALGAISAMKEEGYKIPDDISLISFDDQPYAAYLSTPLTTIKQRSSEIGKIAIRMLLEQIEHGQPKESKSILLPPSMVFRDSVKIIRNPR